MVEKDDKYGFIDKNGNVVIPLKYDRAGSFHEGLAPVCIGDKWGFIDKSGKVVIPMKYDAVEYFHNGGAIAMIKGKFGMIDKNGKTIAQFIYDNLVPGELNYCIKDYRLGFLDDNGKTVIPNKYECISFFSEGLVSIEVDGKSGYVNIMDEFVIPCQYDYAGNFEEGVAIVGNESGYGYINKEGKVILPLEFESDNLTKYEDYDWVRGVDKNGKIHICDKKGNYLIPPVYVGSVFYRGFEIFKMESENGDFHYYDKYGKRLK